MGVGFPASIKKTMARTSWAGRRGWNTRIRSNESFKSGSLSSEWRSKMFFQLAHVKRRAIFSADVKLRAILFSISLFFLEKWQLYIDFRFRQWLPSFETRGSKPTGSLWSFIPYWRCTRSLSRHVFSSQVKYHSSSNERTRTKSCRWQVIRNSLLILYFYYSL